MMNPQLSLPELDFRVLDRELDKTKTRVFQAKNAAFLGPLMCNLHFMWDDEIQTACTNGVWIKWNPYYFHFLSAEGRQSILVHELWHVALMHMLRRGTRDPKIWNYACDTVLDNMMDLEGYIVDNSLFPAEMGFPPDAKGFVDHATYGTMAAEEIYDLMIQNQTQAPLSLQMDLVEGQGEGEDDGTPTKSQAQQIINNVVSAYHSAKISNKAGNLPGELETTLKKFLSPKLPWEVLLHNFFNDLSNLEYSWARPNRRYTDVYLPSMMDDHQGLEHVMYFLDVSGSISDEEIIRFHSEFKYVKEKFEPEKMTMVQFDTRIQKEDVFLKDDPFEETHVIGRGGTSLVCVRDHIIEHNPTAVVIFSDLYCAKMEPLPSTCQVPVIWIAINHSDAEVNFGQLVHIKE